MICTKQKKLIGRSEKLKQIKVGMKLTCIQRQIVYGLLLGHVYLEKNGNQYRFIFAQGDKHKAYIKGVYQILAPFCLNPPRPSVHKSGIRHRFATLSLPLWKNIATLFYRGNGKGITKRIWRHITPLSLGYWYADHGSMKGKDNKTLIFNTHGFTLDECGILCECLSNKFQLNC